MCSTYTPMIDIHPPYVMVPAACSTHLMLVTVHILATGDCYIRPCALPTKLVVNPRHVRA
jgi:hypothetical protein